jgi:hypothetical protein
MHDLALLFSGKAPLKPPSVGGGKSFLDLPSVFFILLDQSFARQQIYWQG